MDRRDYNNEERDTFNNTGYTPRNRRFNFSRSDYQNMETNNSFDANRQNYAPQQNFQAQNNYQPPQYSQPFVQNPSFSQPTQPQPQAMPVSQAMNGAYPQYQQPMQNTGYQQGGQFVQNSQNQFYPLEGTMNFENIPQPEQHKKKGWFSKSKKSNQPITQGDLQNILIVAPKTMTDIQDIIDNLRNRQAVIVEFNKINEKYTQRTLDFLNGAIYALGGSEQRINDCMFLYTPGGVSIQGPSSLNKKY